MGVAKYVDVHSMTYACCLPTVCFSKSLFRAVHHFPRQCCNRVGLRLGSMPQKGQKGKTKKNILFVRFLRITAAQSPVFTVARQTQLRPSFWYLNFQPARSGLGFLPLEK